MEGQKKKKEEEEKSNSYLKMMPTYLFGSWIDLKN